MERFVQRIRLLCLLTGSAVIPAGAQDSDRSIMLRLEPGMLTADFLSAPRDVPSASGFNLRFSTVVPTKWRWVRPMVGASVTPYGTSGYSDRNTNTPVLFAGNVFPVVDLQDTGGWFRFEVPLLWVYAYNGGGRHNTRLYGRDVYVELGTEFALGEKLLGELGSGWRRVLLYGRLQQNLTPNPDFTTRRTDRFNPFALYGITIRLGGSNTP